MTSPSVPTNDPTEEPVPDAPEFRAAVKRLLWRLLVITILVGIVSSLSGSVLLAALLAVVLYLPVVFLTGLIRHNRQCVRNVTIGKLLLCLLLVGLYALPMILVLAPGIVVNMGVDFLADKAFAAANSMLHATEQKHRIVEEIVPYPWYIPYSWFGVNKVVNVVKSIEVPRYTGYARLGIKALRDAIVVFQIYWYAFFVFILIRAAGYVLARVAHRTGMTLLMSFED